MFICDTQTGYRQEGVQTQKICNLLAAIYLPAQTSKVQPTPLSMIILLCVIEYTPTMATITNGTSIIANDGHRTWEVLSSVVKKNGGFISSRIAGSFAETAKKDGEAVGIGMGSPPLLGSVSEFSNLVKRADIQPNSFREWFLLEIRVHILFDTKRHNNATQNQHLSVCVGQGEVKERQPT